MRLFLSLLIISTLFSCQKSTTQFQNENGGTLFETQQRVYYSPSPAEPFDYYESIVKQFEKNKRFIFAVPNRECFDLYVFNGDTVLFQKKVYGVTTCGYYVENDSMCFTLLALDSIGGHWNGYTPDGQEILAQKTKGTGLRFVPKRLTLLDNGKVEVIFSNWTSEFFDMNPKLYAEKCSYEVISNFEGEDKDGSKKKFVTIHFCGGVSMMTMPEEDAIATHGEACNCPGLYPKQ